MNEEDLKKAKKLIKILGLHPGGGGSNPPTSTKNEIYTSLIRL